MRRAILAAVVAVGLHPTFAAAAAEMTEGQVQKIDLAQGKITLRHGPIKSLDMDSMTMVFRVRDPAMLDGLRAGDRIRFEADRVDGRITIIRLEKAI